MARQVNATALAIQELNKFLADWLGPTANQFLAASGDLAKVYESIRAIAPAEKPKGIGYAVFGVKPETHERRRVSGFEAVVISAVFDEPPTSIVESRQHPLYPPAYVDHVPFIDYGICLLQQIPN